MNEYDFERYIAPFHDAMESLQGKKFYMDHMIAGEQREGDYLYHGIENLPPIGSSVNGVYRAGEGISTPYIFRVVGMCFYEVEVNRPRHSKSIGAILIDPVIPSDLHLPKLDTQ
jgi:hypothetical protein